MRKQIGKRAVKAEPKANKLKVVEFVENNIQNNLALRRDHLYLEDVKSAMNINTLEQRIILRKQILSLLNEGVPATRLRQLLLQANEKDIHLMIKNYKLKI
ncbi:MAG TPA: hypothetical protein VJ939_09420 [Bacteroidales bacterium]|nr:hypothetical protein [Bacteroidales bacterium]